MQNENRLPIALLALRLTVFLVMFVWTLDKFLAPDHAASVFENFYFLSGLGPLVMYVIGAIELVIILGFVLGLAKRFTYGAVLVFHAMSTLASFPLYLNPAEGILCGLADVGRVFCPLPVEGERYDVRGSAVALKTSTRTPRRARTGRPSGWGERKRPGGLQE